LGAVVEPGADLPTDAITTLPEQLLVVGLARGSAKQTIVEFVAGVCGANASEPLSVCAEAAADARAHAGGRVDRE
jgi:hypothetical protein